MVKLWKRGSSCKSLFEHGGLCRGKLGCQWLFYFFPNWLKYGTSPSHADSPSCNWASGIPPPIERVKEILDHYNIFFFADEVQAGFARTGKMFAIEHYNVEPDIMAMAQGIANGFPLSAFIAPGEIADTLQPGEHLSTSGGKPVNCTASLATTNFFGVRDPR